MQKFRFFLISILFALSAPISATAQPTARLAEGGKAHQKITISANASERVKIAAATLAEYLKRISGAQFETQNGDGKSGITLGVASDFPELNLAKEFDLQDPTQREDYILRSHVNGVLLVGASELAVEHAVWDLLYRLGYRQFFPSANWEVVPSTPDIKISVDEKEHPDYVSRRIWFTYNSWLDNARRMDAWSEKNRVAQGIELNTGHAYGGIMSARKAEFAAHPEYKGLVNGERKSSKFCISNPGLRQLVVDYALKYFEKRPEATMISMDPTDGGGWCECEQCAKIGNGSPSDRAVFLANTVAEAINQKFGAKYVGMYAYNFHSPPPSIKVHPNVVVSVATAFIKGGFTFDQLVEGWQKQGATIGIRDYYSIVTWDGDMPGRAKASRLEQLAQSIVKHHQMGARFLTSESGDNWGPNGLGYYFAARVLWDTKEAAQLDEVVDDFLTKSFGAAKPAMHEYYLLISPQSRAPMSDDKLGRLYRALDAARKQTKDERVLARINDLALYTHYIELRLAYSRASGEARQQAFETMMRYVYRIHPTHMVHSLGLWRDVAIRDKAVKFPKEADWKIAESKNPWKSSEPIAPQEIAGYIQNGVDNYEIVDIEEKSFSADLVPASRLNLPTVERGNFGSYRGKLNVSRGTRNYFIWLEANRAAQFEVTAGLIYKNLGPARLRLLPPELDAEIPQAEDDKKQEDGEQIVAGAAAPPPIDAAEVVPDGAAHTVSLKAREAGLHRVQVSDSSDATSLEWSPELPITIKSSLDSDPRIMTGFTLCFYVPKGTKTVGGFSTGQNSSRVSIMRDGSGQIRHTFSKEAGYFNVPVPAGQDGQLWKLENCAGQRQLMTVPPYLARSEKELLLPREVVEVDAR